VAAHLPSRQPRLRFAVAPSLPRTSGKGVLYLWFADSSLRAAAVRSLRAARRETELSISCVRVAMPEGELDQCILQLGADLARGDTRRARALFVAGDEDPSLDDFGRITTLHELHVFAQTGWLLQELEHGRITSHFHPIVHVSDTSRVFAHEALLRGAGPDGEPLEPLSILQLAREAGLMAQLDLAACRSAIREAAQLDPSVTVFINFSPGMIDEADSCLRATVAAIDAAGLDHGRFVFEVIEADRIDDAANLKRVLDSYRRDGFRVALDDLGAGWSTLTLVHRLRPDFIKLDRELIRQVHRDPVKDLIASKLLEIGRGLGIRTIVEGVEHRAELQWARARGADFVQGFLIARPAPGPRRQTPG
jgi:EAL domain-containing protein (putative c-di-GMP-specific phosphodiesterase class I)